MDLVAFHGAFAGLLWTAQGTIMVSYTTPGKNRYKILTNWIFTAFRLSRVSRAERHDTS